MNETPFMKPVLFLVFIILSAGVLYSMLLRPLLGFKAPEQTPPEVAAQVTAKTPSIIPLRPQNSSASESTGTSAIQESAIAPEPLPVVAVTDPDPAIEKIEEVAASVITESQELNEFVVMPAESIPPSLEIESSITTTSPAMPETVDPEPVIELNPAANLAKETKTKEKKLLAEQVVKAPAEEVKSRPEILSAPPLSETSKQYLNRMNRLLDQELDK